MQDRRYQAHHGVLFAPNCHCYRTWNLCRPCVAWNELHELNREES